MPSVNLNPTVLRHDVGKRSTVARNAILALENLLPDTGDEKNLFAIQTYYAILIKRLTARCLYPDQLPAWDEMESGLCFRRRGILNFTEHDRYSQYLLALNELEVVLHEIDRCIQNYRFDSLPPDILKTLHHDLFSSIRRQATGEFYTPDWLANYMLTTLNYDGTQRLLDPTCGSGIFLALALRRAMQHFPAHIALEHIAGIDIHPLAVLAAKANLLLTIGRAYSGDITLPIFERDALLNPPDIGRYDLVVGNPPWMNREAMADIHWKQTQPLWQHYGLFVAHEGMDHILGKAKKDLAMLMVYACADKYLQEGGHLGFVIPHSAFKSGGAGAGFRRFQTDTLALRVWQVDDLSSSQSFPGAAAPAAVLFLQKGSPTRYPVQYNIWYARTRRHIADDTVSSIHTLFVSAQAEAEPVNPFDLTSPWITGSRPALDSLKRLRGPSDYTAHAGAYTGGANSVYWLDVLETIPGGFLRVRNIVETARLPVPQVEALIEADLVFPLLRGSDVRRWSAAPGAFILLVQNPQTRRGYEVTWLQQHYPLTYAYLLQFETFLRQRSTYRRYFRTGTPFYTMFDVGEYTFAPVKVVWQGMGVGQMRAAVTTATARPVIPNQAMHPFIALSDADEAHYLAACLNSAVFEFAVLSHTGRRSRSFAQPGLLKRLCLSRYQPDDARHQMLAGLSRQAHDSSGDISPLEADIDRIAAELWGITAVELKEIQRALQVYQTGINTGD